MLRPFVGCALIALIAAAAHTASARASFVVAGGSGQSSRTYGLIADPGEANDVVVTYDRETNTSRISDTAGIHRLPLAPGSQPAPGFFCDEASPTEVVCPGPPGGGELKDGDDRLEVRGDLSPYTQTLEDLVADPGGSVPIVVPLGVLVNGGAGDDTIIGGPGWDRLFGGSNESSYGSANDVLVGNGSPDYLVGGDGDDRVDGGPGNDELSANEGDDIVTGGEGHDFLEVWTSSKETGFGAGDDRYSGGPGNDMIRSFLGRDRIDGGPGDDGIFLTHFPGDLLPAGAKDDRKRASVDCAPGNDLVEVGRGDTLRGCERLLMHLPCGVCSRVASLVTTGRGRAVTLARKKVSQTRRRYSDTIALGAGVRRALAREATVKVRFLLGSDLLRTFTLRR